MNYLIHLMITLSALTMTECTVQQDATPPQEIFKHWVHSHEEDGDDFRIFRPSSYEFPLSRGREGFEIKENGTFIWYRIAPADGSEEHRGSWEWQDNDELVVTFNKGAPKEGMKLKILELWEDKLKVK